jgi:hypothetical protein
MKFIAEHALPLGLTFTGACIALALVRHFFSPSESKRFVANALAIAFLFLATTYWFAANREYIVEHGTSFADLFREEPRSSLPTKTGISEWKAAFSGFVLTWPEGGTLETERPSDLISFDPDIEGYYAGQGRQEDASLFAAVGFEGGEVAWFTCHVLRGFQSGRLRIEPKSVLPSIAVRCRTDGTPGSRTQAEITGCHSATFPNCPMRCQTSGGLPWLPSAPPLSVRRS